MPSPDFTAQIVKAMEPTFKQSEENSKGLIEMFFGEDCVARMTFSRMDSSNVIIDHTAVDPKLEGTGAGKKIVEHLVEWARSNNQKVLPLCPFTKAVLAKNESWRDIIRK